MRVDSITSRQAALTGSFTGSFVGNASGLTGIASATSASYALTASYAENAGGGSGAGFPYTGSAHLTGSFSVTGSVGLSYYDTGSSAYVRSFTYSNNTGYTTVSCLIETSALRYKENVQSLGSQINKVKRLRPVEFDWNTNNKHSVGFVADEVEEIYPELVARNDTGQVEGMDYSKMVAVLVASVQEQQSQIEKLTQELETLKNKTN